MVASSRIGPRALFITVLFWVLSNSPRALDPCPPPEIQAVEAYRAGDFAEAACLLDAAVKASPRNPELLKYLGFARAACAYEQTLDLNRMSPAEAERTRTESARARDAFLAYLAAGGRDSERVTCYLDEIFISPLVEKESLGFLERAVKSSPSNPLYWRWLAKVQHASGLLPKALDSAREWQAHSQDPAEAFLFYCNLALRQLAYSNEIKRSLLLAVEKDLEAHVRFSREHPDDPRALQTVLVLMRIRAQLAVGSTKYSEAAAAAERARSAFEDELACLKRDCGEGSADGNRSWWPESVRPCRGAFAEYLPFDPPSYFLDLPCGRRAEIPKRPATSPDSEVRPVGSIRPPRTIREVRPHYPLAAASAGTSGRVVCELLIDRAGRVSDARVLQSTDPIFDNAALECVRLWRFTRPSVDDPREESGAFVGVYHIIVINFKMK